MAVYLLKTYTVMSNRQLGEICGEIGITSVSKAHERFKEKLYNNKALKKQLRCFLKNMSNVKI